MKTHIYIVDRESYRAWRAQCPSSLLSPLSQVSKWLGAAPALSVPTLPQGEPDKPEQGAAAKHETELQMHRRECKEIGKRLWDENPNSTKAALMKHPDMQFYVQAYKGKNTVPGWLAEIDPRPKEERRGRPKKYPSENPVCRK